MSEQMIGIKTGDGKFFPVLEENFKGRKRFVLTTVTDNQASVQIDFYRSATSDIDTAEYIGSLVIENIEPAPSRGPEIEVIVGIDTENSLHAVARNLSADSEKQSLTVSLESLSSGLTYDIPEFELDEKLQPTSLFEGDNQDFSQADDDELKVTGNRQKTVPVAKKRGPATVILIVLMGLLIIALIFLGIFFLPDWLNKTKEPKPDLQATGSSVPTEAVQTEVPTKMAASATPQPEPTEKPAPPPEEAVSSKPPPVPANTTEGGAAYTIKRGDTLWDIATRVYGDPWDYQKIYNNNSGQIRNPNLIYSGRKIYLPEN